MYSPPCDDEMTFSFDDWSCGIILYAMLTCTLPFSPQTLRTKGNLILNVPQHISDGEEEERFDERFLTKNIFRNLSHFQ